MPQLVKNALWTAIVAGLLVISGCSSSSGGDSCDIKEVENNALTQVGSDGSTQIDEQKLSQLLEDFTAPEGSSDKSLVARVAEEEEVTVKVLESLNNDQPSSLLGNILSAEQSQFNASKNLQVDFDGISGDWLDTLNFNFEDDLQGLHDGLVALGAASQFDSLVAAANLMEWDIEQKLEHLNAAEEEVIVSFTNGLVSASRNHLRAIVDSIRQSGQDYQPVYLSDAEFQLIVDGS